MNAAGLLLRICAQGSGRSLILIRDNVALQSVQVTGTRLQHSKSRPTSSQGVPQPGQADPFTSSLQSKTEKELLEQVLRQAQQEEAAEEAAEQKRVNQRGEHGGPKGEEPTRFGDWEKGGRCYDF